jgi:hypothetical protein
LLSRVGLLVCRLLRRRPLRRLPTVGRLLQHLFPAHRHARRRPLGQFARMRGRHVGLVLYSHAPGGRRQTLGGSRAHRSCGSRSARHAVLVDRFDFDQQLVGHFHRHAAEVGHEVDAIRVGRQVALRTLASPLPAQRQDHAAVAAPIGRERRNRFEAMGDAVVDLLLVLLLWHSQRIPNTIRRSAPSRRCSWICTW